MCTSMHVCMYVLYLYTNESCCYRKQQEVPGYDPSLYESRRTLAVSRDAVGTLIPISLVYKKEPHGSSDAVRPLLLYGYGSYGVCIDPSFDFKRTALLDRGRLPHDLGVLTYFPMP